jgi:hypothetical protein
MKTKFAESRKSRVEGKYGSREKHPRQMKLILSAVAGLIFLAALGVRAQQSGSHASDFSSVEYFPAPHQQEMKSRLSGAEAQPLPGGLLAIKQLKLETFNTNGSPAMVVEAPECVYDTLKGLASSPGHLQLRTGDGNFRIEGEGFLWRQNESSLTISNQIHTVIENGTDEKIGI